jgi:uncharacterized hydrophobic protein (TIGR00271 family)
LLILSAVIIAAGLLLNNSAIVIGGMLVTPVLIPILLVSLGLVVGEIGALKTEGVLMAKSFSIIFLISFMSAIVFGLSPGTQIIENTFRAAVLYFLVAFAAGVAATFAMVRKEIAEVLPGIAIAVSLVPPLSLVGIWLSVLNLEFARFYFSIFLFNLVGIVLGSFVVFSILKFHRAEKKVTAESKKLEEQVREREV